MKIAVGLTGVMIVLLVLKVANEAWRSKIPPWTVSGGLRYARCQAITSFTAIKRLFFKMI